MDRSADKRNISLTGLQPVFLQLNLLPFSRPGYNTPSSLIRPVGDGVR